MTERLSLLPSKIFGVKRLFGSNRFPTNESETASRNNAVPVQFMGDDYDNQSTVTSPKLFAISTSNAESVSQLDASQHIFGIERQFEQLHAHINTRPLTSFSDLRYDKPSSSVPHAPRHVDLVQALFSQHRYQMTSGGALSPTQPYNEDIADRNMNGSVNEKIHQKPHSRIVSTIYQEDVADRNIARSKSQSSLIQPPPRSPLRKRNAPRREQPSKVIEGTGDAGPNKEIRQGVGQPVSRNRQANGRGLVVGDNPATLAPISSGLRTQRSAPNLIANRQTSLVVTVDGQKAKLNSHPPKQQDRSSLAVTPSTLSLSSNSTISNASRPVSRRNVRDLSINTELASSQRLPIKIEHRAIQPPTPSYQSNERGVTIAEIVHSPLPSVSSAGSTSYKVEEIMDMFKQAYISTHATDHHPTFETLQDAIVREINSHDAFRRVPIPDHGPPFTPPPSEQSFEDTMNELVGDEKSKPTGKASRGRKRRKSLSLINLTKGLDKNTPKKRSTSAPRRRRHTYAEPPSTDWITSLDQSASTATLEALGASNPQNLSVPDGKPFVKSHMKRKSEPLQPSSPAFETLEVPSNGRENALRTQYTPPLGMSTIDPVQNLINDQAIEVSRENNMVRAVDKNDVTYIVNANEPLTALELINRNKSVGNSMNHSIRTLENHRSKSTPSLNGNARPKEIAKLRRNGS